MKPSKKKKKPTSCLPNWQFPVSISPLKTKKHNNTQTSFGEVRPFWSDFFFLHRNSAMSQTKKILDTHIAEKNTLSTRFQRISGAITRVTGSVSAFIVALLVI